MSKNKTQAPAQRSAPKTPTQVADDRRTELSGTSTSAPSEGSGTGKRGPRPHMGAPSAVATSGAEKLSLVPKMGGGGGSSYQGLFDKFMALESDNPKNNALVLTPPEGIAATRYRANLIQGFRKLVPENDPRGWADYRLSTDGKVVVIKLRDE